MKYNIFSQFKKQSFSHSILAMVMVLSLVLQNAAFVQYAFANEVETRSTSQSFATAEESESHSESVTSFSSSHSEVHSSSQNEEGEDSDSNHTVVKNEKESDDSASDEHEVVVTVHQDENASSSVKTEDENNHEENEGDESHDGDDIGTIKDIFHELDNSKPAVKIIATSIVCDNESKLPNWGLGANAITSHTATDYVAGHPGCALTSDWKFQWGFSGVNDLSGNFVGEADGSKGPNTNTGTGLGDWKTFGPSDANGVAMTTICDIQGSPRIWVREVLKDGFIPFTFDPAHPINDNTVSAEMYCSTDVHNYDNYDYISSPVLGTTYNCVSFNVKKPVVHANTAPVITVVGANPTSIFQDATYVDLKATVLDAEDGDITARLITTGTVNTAVLGSYTITYNATDSQNLAATPKTRTVNVVANTCTTNCAVNHPPVITLVGVTPVSVTQNTVYTDLGATAVDLEDGTITPVKTGVVNTAVLGTYTLTYNATDSKGATATPVTRTVNVVPATGCVTNCTVNTAPVITVVGANPTSIFQDATYVDLKATVLDAEDGDITAKLVTTGTVNTHVLGSYTITYNATDSQNLAATPKTRTVNVVPVGTPTNEKPEITLLGDVIMQLTIGTAFTDPSATVHDTEDGDITAKLVTTGNVNTAVLGSYTITYNATDSQNLAATPKTRTVNVVPATTGCTTNCGGGSTTFDYYGCINPSATNYNRLANKDDGSCVYGGGGGGGGSVPLTITNEKLTVTGTTTVTVTWNTNLAADSRVVYGMDPVATLGAKPSYGYSLTNATDTTYVYNHSMVITGIPSAIKTYFRPVSSITSETAVGVELVRTPDVTTPAPLACEYLKEYMRIGVNNNPTEVTKLQLFLKNYEGMSTLAVTGFFDTTTDKAVRAFQDKYKKDVLDTWNLTGNTGYVYYTTEKKINEIYCQREFPLNATQANEISSFRALIERVNTVGSTTGTAVLPLVGTNKTQGATGGSVAGASTVKTPVVITVTPTQTVTGNGYAALNAEASKKVEGDSENSVETRGRIAIADLLATAPSVAQNIGGDNASDTSAAYEVGTDVDEGLALEASTKKNLLAGVVNSLSLRMHNCSATTIYFTILFLLLALIFATLYIRAAIASKEMIIEEKAKVE